MSIAALLLAASLAVSSQQTQAAPPPAAGTEALSQAYFLFLQARVLDDDGDLNGAIAAYRQVLDLIPAAAEVRADLATAYARQGKSTEALAEALTALKTDPANRVAHRVMGFVQASIAESATDAKQQANLVSEAIGHFEKALEGGTGDLAVELTVARLYVQTGQPLKAIPTLQSFLDDRPDYAEAVLLLADAYEGAHRLPDAVAAVEALVADQPADTSARTRLAGLYEETGRWADAAAGWAELSRRNPQILGFRTRRATALVNAGDVDAGRDALLAILKDAPREVPVWYLLSQVERRAGHGAAAEDAARHIAEIDPADPRGPLALAEAKLVSKDYPGAIALLEPFVTAPRAADVESGVYARAAGQMAVALEGAGDFAKAEVTLRGVVARDASNAEALNDLGYMLADRGQKLDEAVGLIERALQIDPDNQSFLDSLGWAQVKRGKPDLGRPSLEHAAIGMPKNSVILDHLGEAYFQLKRYKDAAGAWDRSLSGDLAGIDAAAVTKKRDKARELAGK
jgi:tetratricopeptide (TPR) repeat protein